MGHFARECRAPRNKEGQFRNQGNTRKQGNNEDTSSNAMLAIDGVAAAYKKGLATVEEQLITYRKNEVLFSEEVVVLKREVACKDYEINILKSEFEKVKQKKEGIEFKIKKFDKASKDLDKLLGSQITDKSKKGLGYNVVPPPHPLIYNRPKKLDLSYSGLDEFKEPEFKGYGSENSKQESNIVCDQKSDDSKENFDDSLVKEQVSKDTSSFVESLLNVDKETVFPVDKKVEFVKPKNHEKLVKKSVRYAEMYRSQTPKGNQRNWNGQKSNQLGSDFVMYNKACFICGSFNHVQAQCKYHQREGMVYGNTYNRVNYNYTTKRTHPNAQRNMVPRAVSYMKDWFTQAVNTARPKVVKTARPNYAVVNAVRVNQANAGKPQQDDTGFVDSGCSRHMTGNIAYLSDFKEFDGGYVAFGGGAHGDKSVKHIGKSKEVGTLRYLSLVVTLKKVGDEAIHKELGDRMERAATTASSLEAEQDSGSGPRCQDTILGDVDAQTRFKTTSKQSYDQPLSRGYTLGSGEDNLKLLKLMELSLIDKKKLIITEISIRSDLYLEDAGGTDCLPTATIFEELARMRRKGFVLRRLTPLFETMMVRPTQDKGVDSGIPGDSLQTPIPTQPSSSRSQKKQSRRKHKKDTVVTQEETQPDANVPIPSNDPPLSGEDSMQTI
ncbi:hypothetical protein Tco_0092374 [Tanacetum coccineum]